MLDKWSFHDLGRTVFGGFLGQHPPEITLDAFRFLFAYLGDMPLLESDDAAWWSALRAEAGVWAPDAVLGFGEQWNRKPG